MKEEYTEKELDNAIGCLIVLKSMFEKKATEKVTYRGTIKALDVAIHVCQEKSQNIVKNI